MQVLHPIRCVERLRHLAVLVAQVAAVDLAQVAAVVAGRLTAQVALVALPRILTLLVAAVDGVVLVALLTPTAVVAEVGGLLAVLEFSLVLAAVVAAQVAQALRADHQQ